MRVFQKLCDDIFLFDGICEENGFVVFDRWINMRVVQRLIDGVYVGGIKQNCVLFFLCVGGVCILFVIDELCN